MPSCCAYNCGKKLHECYAVFLIPQGKRDVWRREQWLLNIGRKNFVPTKNSVVCETGNLPRSSFVTSPTGNWHSALGAADLGSKNLVEERILGTLFGMPTRRKRGNQGESDSTTAKRQPDDTTNEAKDEEMSSAEQANAPSAGGAGAGGNHPNTFECVQQILRVPPDHGVVTVSQDSKILATWGYAMLNTSLKYDGEKTFPGIVTSMSRHLVDRPYLYIPHGTFLNLPVHTKAL
ncbi:hypothetical protein HPB51_028261 [Rhipicephalus microplus]|uniref:THAP-type domain-containing protein n=1 Tax=Rhipicephalus microplus TaxID=6941 RepID=A0A9J6CXE9_RHIMP|nr:hypothetical protein HPB51_028261 [Rhipicephalus microplus]